MVGKACQLTLADLGGGVSTAGAGLLLLVERALTAATAEGVRLGLALTEGSRTLGLWREETIQVSICGMSAMGPFASFHGRHLPGSRAIHSIHPSIVPSVRP